MDNSSTGSFASGHARRAGTQAPWSSPRTVSNVTSWSPARRTPATRAANPGSPGAGYSICDSSSGNPPKSYNSGIRSQAVTRKGRDTCQCDEIIKIPRASECFAPNPSRAAACASPPSADIGDPCARKTAGFRIEIHRVEVEGRLLLLHHDHRHFGRDVLMQPHRHLEFAQRLEGLVQLDLALVDGEVLPSQRVG